MHTALYSIATLHISGALACVLQYRLQAAYATALKQVMRQEYTVMIAVQVQNVYTSKATCMLSTSGAPHCTISIHSNTADATDTTELCSLMHNC
jgi:uncharacterized phage protein gp47/JayE